MTDSPSDIPDPAYRAFLEQAVAGGEVWGLSDPEGWALAPAADDDTVMVMPFWSGEAGAGSCATGDWQGFTPEAVPLDLFLEEWLPGMEGDGLRVGVDWTDELEGVEVPPLELQADLEATIVAWSEAEDDTGDDPDAS
ncbi:DUF2750 domain-containing protein [Aquisalimonas lutea]|uniref:DUF2750 domain-containing protein n=1 Tax=Aquisalimonas lutea TaxID=1327750 RepID=UPI0025B3CA43|nr:DUF2750 domain-containing protein [Aquisalimonas lutea]MDN3518654.1 DUF2750 domain-containing protein [Aquisalimonas lutea]